MEIPADKYNQPANYYDYIETTLNNIWKELLPYKDRIYFIHSGLASQFSIINKRPEELLLQQITDAYNQGYRHMIFDNVGEGMQDPVTLKIHNVIELAKKVFPDIVFAYLAGAVNSHQTYLKTCKQYNLEPNMIVLSCYYFEYHARNNFVPEESPAAAGEYLIYPRNKYFSCLNRIIRPHRLELLERMLLEDLVNDKCYYSMYDSSQPDGGLGDAIAAYGLYRLPNVKKNKELVETLRLNFDPARDNPIDIRVEDLPLYDDTYFSVVPETFYYEPKFYEAFFGANISPNSDSIFFSEKTYKPILTLHPFIVVNRAFSLVKLRERGYQTFHPYIDESYDLIDHDPRRMAAIVDEVKRLCNQTEDEWREWQEHIKPIVEYNRRLLFNQETYLVQKDLNKFLETF